MSCSERWGLCGGSLPSPLTQCWMAWRGSGVLSEEDPLRERAVAWDSLERLLVSFVMVTHDESKREIGNRHLCVWKVLAWEKG